MLGAIIGDIVGSRWEFNPTNDYNFEWLSNENAFTDDTICTVGVADALLMNRDFGEEFIRKCFTGSANFDINNFTSYINEIKVKPYKLHSKYLIFKYFMKDGVVTIENCWLKNVWEISSPSEKYPVKNQNKRGVIYNLRPSTWYSEKGDYPSFTCLEHFLAAMEQTIYKYGPTNSMADGWLDTVLTNYKKFYGKDLVVPRWIDIKSQYQKR